MSHKSLSQLSHVKDGLCSSPPNPIKQRITKSKSFNSLKSYYHSAMATFSSASQLSEKQMDFRKSSLWLQFTNSIPFKKKEKGVKKVDVLIINGNDAIECSKHMSDYLSKFGSIEVHTENIDNCSFSEETLKVMFTYNVTLLIVSPDFLEFIETRPEMHEISKRLTASKTFAILCGLQMKDVTVYHRTMLISFDEWFCFVVTEQNKQNVNSVTKKICNILFHSNYSTFNVPSAYCHSFKWNTGSRFNLRLFPANSVQRFKLSTKKVDEDNRKIFLLLKQPLHHKQKLRIILDFSPENDFSDVQEIDVIIKNAFTAKLVIAEKYVRRAEAFTVNVYIDGVNCEFLGSQIVRCAHITKLWFLEDMNALLPVLSTALSALSAESVTEIDTRLAKHVTNSEYSLLGNRSLAEVSVTNREFPTLLHFSAKYGLEKLTNLLLQCPDAHIAAKLRNSRGVNAWQIAFQNNFGDIGRNIEHFVVSQCLSPKLPKHSAYQLESSRDLQECRTRECSDRNRESCVGAMDSILSAIEFDYDVPKVLQNLFHKIKFSDHSSTKAAAINYN